LYTVGKKIEPWVNNTFFLFCINYIFKPHQSFTLKNTYES
jgi:hypothetical protein